MAKSNGYLDDEINKLNEDRLVTEAKVKAAQYSFAETMKKDLGVKIKKTVKPSKWQMFKDKISNVFKRLGTVYG